MADNVAVARPTPEAIFVWFNAWLKEPLNEREEIIIREVFHCIDYPAGVARAVSQVAAGITTRKSAPQPGCVELRERPNTDAAQET